MTDLLSREQIKKLLPVWKYDFLEWSQSPFGFYVDRHFDVETDMWIEAAEGTPVRWHERPAKAIKYLFTYDKNGSVPHSTVYWFDIAQSGKTLLQAAIGQHIGMFHDYRAKVQFSANAQEQAAQRCFGYMKASIALNPYRDIFIERINVNEIEFAFTNNLARAIPRNAGSQAGADSIFTGTDEFWAITTEAAIQHYEELKKTPARNISIKFNTSYPPYIGDPGPANEILDKFFDERGRPRKEIERVFDDLPLYVDAHGQAVWWNKDPYPWHLRIMPTGNTYIEDERADAGSRKNFFMRTWCAERVQNTDAFVSHEDWDACTDIKVRPVWPMGEDENVPMVLGVDLAARNDTSFVVGRSFDPVSGKYILRIHRMFDPADYSGSSVLVEVQNYIFSLHKKHKVLAVYIDPSQAYLMSQQLSDVRVNMIEVDQNKTRVVTDTQYYQHITGHRLSNYIEAHELREHVINAVAAYKENDTMRIDKRKTTMKIDGAVADAMCCFGVTEYRAEFERIARRRKSPALFNKAPDRTNPFRQVFFGG